MPELIVDLERVGVDAIAAGEGKNLKFERRSADRGDRLRSLAAELVRLKVDLILANGTRAARAAKEATKEATKAIPIVFSLGEDPVTNGLVASFARPGGNLTGFDEGFFLDIALGIVGAVIGSWLFSLFGMHRVTGLNIYSLVVAFIGAVVFLVVYHAIRRAV